MNKKFNLNIKPNNKICPEKYCFHWCYKKYCTEKRCCRFEPTSEFDFYEAHEPQLEKDGLPWFYFIPSFNHLNETLIKEYIEESEKIWGKEHWLK